MAISTNLTLTLIMTLSCAQPTPFLKFARFRFHLQVCTLMILPPYKGAIFRGVFGAGLRRLVCVTRQRDCNGCLLRPTCLYVILFEPQPPPGFADVGKFHQAPRPYVLIPPLTARQSFHPGETLAFDLVLIGPAIEALPYFIQLFQDQGRRGLGRERGRYALLQVNQIRDGTLQLVFDSKTNTLFRWEMESGPACFPSTEQVNTITLKFLSPLRLKVKGDLVTKLTFPLLWERLGQRVTRLADLYGDGAVTGYSGTAESPWSIWFEELSAQAANVSNLQDNLHWYDWERYSRRQEASMKFGGLVGTITFAGPLRPFLPYLRLGEQLHVGQGTTFGLGGYILTFPKTSNLDRKGEADDQFRQSL